MTGTERFVASYYGMTPVDLCDEATHGELKAYIALASFQGSNDFAWPGQDELCSRLFKVAREDVTKTMRNKLSVWMSGLVGKGWVYRQRRIGKTNRYSCVMAGQSIPGNIGKREAPRVPEISGNGFPEISGDAIPEISGKNTDKNNDKNKRKEHYGAAKMKPITSWMEAQGLRFQAAAQERRLALLEKKAGKRSAEEWVAILETFEAGKKNGAFWAKTQSGKPNMAPPLLTSIQPGLVSYIEAYAEEKAAGSVGTTYSPEARARNEAMRKIL